MITPIAQTLSPAAFDQLVANARSIEEDSYGPKVYQFENGDYLKLFRRKRLLSSALLTPYSVRFWRNAVRLKELGIPTITPLQLFKLPKAGWTAVRYQALAGTTLKSVYERDRQLSDALLEQLVALFRTLHRKGIYFRSMHLGNIVLTEDEQLGLIDIADLTFQSRALSRNKASRNLAHFERYLKHNDLMAEFPFEKLCTKVLAR
ncbi:lipopolysaccharide kinase InaA family protein [Ectopseudomonas guguanensis]|uniref:lipopolysaccharide kinase InaA family protein n=1 Tax=Ectopseudomonas guguanensis TaxID=1198456 RepID=UPI0028B1CBC6|nr:lipopolysaccharide kinase InaA family protein [Pseudomonas guguanensis]